MTYRNAILICADQWRGDCLSIRNEDGPQTPYLDGLARTGTLYTNAYSMNPTCVPARMSLMTGLHAEHHGRVSYSDGVPFDIDTTLPGEFRNAGYQTQAIGKMHYSPERGRIGFDDVLLHDGYLHYSRGRNRDTDFYDDYLMWLREQSGENAASDYLDDGVHCNSVVARPWSRSENLHPTNWVITQAIRWLYRRDPTVPFFLYLSFHRPHPPYNPPRWAFEQYLGTGDYQPACGNWTGRFDQYRDDALPDAFVAQYSQPVLNRARAGYYGNMSHIDQQVERFLEILNEFGLRDDTIICFTSDHGEMLGNHRLWRKGYPYEGSAHIPLILVGPGIEANSVDDRLVSLEDIMPTLLSLSGVESTGDVDGADLSATSSEIAGRSLHGEHILFGQSLQWIRTGDWKYVWLSGSGDEQLFNITNDPAEMVDLLAGTTPPDEGSPAGDALRMCRQQLVGRLAGREEGFVQAGQLIAGRPVQAVLGGAGKTPRGVAHHPAGEPLPPH